MQVESDGGFRVVWEFSGPRMRGHREGRRLKRRELGILLGVAADTIRFYEYERNPPSVLTLGLMASIFGITPNDFFRRFREDEREREDGIAHQRAILTGLGLPPRIRAPQQ